MPNRSRKIRLVLFVLVTFLLAGCSALDGTIVGSGQSNHNQPDIPLKPGMSLGQTFTTRQSGLAGVELFLTPQPESDAKIFLTLYKAPQDTMPIAEASLDLSSAVSPGWYRLSFPIRPEPYPADFYLTLQGEGTGIVNVASSNGASYLEGSAYQDGQPMQDAQLAFQLVYDRGAAAAGLVAQGLQWLAWLALAGVLFVFPGWVLLSNLWVEWPGLFLGERLGLAIGASLGIYPLLFLWTHLVGLQLGVFYAILPPGIAILYLLYKTIKGSGKNKPFTFSLPRKLPKLNPADLAFLVLAGIIFGVRLYIARPLSLPLWGDSYQHSVITQLLMDNKGLFQSWQPYAEIAGLTYHFGFHSLAAVFGWAAGLNGAQAVLWFGQILNGLAILALYPLAVRLNHNRWTGVFAILIGGLLLSMPMFYINWGRYTQLAGQAILPAVLCLAWSAVTTQGKQWRIILLAGMAIGGLALTHYRILILAVLFFIPLLLFANKIPWRARILKAVQVGLVGGLLFLPWFLNLFGGKILAIFGNQLTTPAAAISGFTEQYNSTGSLADYLPIGFWLVLLVSIAWSLWRREPFGLALTGWCFLVILATNPAWLNLPGTGAISNFAILIAAYIPASIFIGAAGGWMIEALPFNRQMIFSGILIFGLVILGIWGGKQRLADAKFNQFTLATRPDLRASNWIRHNLPQDASFLVNSFPAYGGSVMAGSDGGWWLRFLSGHQTSLPPLLYSTEPAPNPHFVQSVADLTHLTYDKGIESPETLAELRRRNIGFVYAGQLQGRAGYGGPYPLEPATLLASSHFQPVYHQDRVWIFEIKP